MKSAYKSNNKKFRQLDEQRGSDIFCFQKQNPVETTIYPNAIRVTNTNTRYQLNFVTTSL